MDSNTAIMLDVVFILGVVGLYMAARLLWKSGIVPQTMRDIYIMTRVRLAKSGWGEYPDTGETSEAYDLEYPNRKENT